MKKLLSLIAAALIGACALLGGCSCGGAEQLSFRMDVPDNEILTYKVEYSENYIKNAEKDARLDSIFTFEYGVGEYVSACRKFDNREQIDSDIKELLKNDNVYELTTNFTIDLKLTIGGKEYTNTESISTLAYVAPSGMSLAPLYAKETAKYFIISVSDNAATVKITETESETFYNQDKYRIVKSYKIYEPDKTEEATTSETSGNYTFRSVIDNAELLFALRGVRLKEQATADIPVVSSAYNTPQTLRITNAVNAEEEFTLNYNGTPITQKIKYNSLNFRKSSTNTAGALQYLNVQSESAGSLPDIGLPLKYAKPLLVYGSFLSMGSLVFTLTDIVR